MLRLRVGRLRPAPDHGRRLAAQGGLRGVRVPRRPHRPLADARQRAADGEHADPGAARVARRPRASRSVRGVPPARAGLPEGTHHLRHRARPRPQRRSAPRLHGGGRGGDPRQARPLRRRDAPGARDHSSASTRATDASRARSSAKLEDKVHVAQPETAVIRLKFKDKADKSKIDDRFTQEVPGRARRDARARATTRSPSRSARRSSRRSASARWRRRRTRSRAASTSSACARPRSRRATRTSSSRCPGSNEQSFRDIKETIRRTARLEFKMVDDAGSDKVFGPPALKDDDLPDGEGIAQYTEMAPDGLDANGHRKSAKAMLRAHVVPAAEVPERDDDRLPRALQGVGARRSTSPTTTRSASRRSPSRSTGPSRCSSSRSAGARCTSTRAPS